MGRRAVSAFDRIANVPVHVVWELTLACNLKCVHCGSRASQARPAELKTEECLDVIGQLAKLGTREVSLIGGEAFIRADWLTIVRAIREHGMDCTMQTGGYKLSSTAIDRAIDAGLQGLGVSLDGLEGVHDRLRGVSGSYHEALRVLEDCRERSLPTSANTQITTHVISQLRELSGVLAERQVRSWQVQLTVAMGNAVDHDSILLQPYELAELMPLLAELYDSGLDHGLILVPGNNVGYFGPFAGLWEESGRDRYDGCTAGRNVMGLEADGTVKGCPSLPRGRYGAGNVRETSLQELWSEHSALHFNRAHEVDALWGFCGTCRHAVTCRGGCTWTADALFGRRGNNPFCHHRVLELAQRGRRERIVKVEGAGPEPFATGRFALIEEEIPQLAGRTESDRVHR